MRTSDPAEGVHQVALVYPYLMHYRYPIARVLSRQHHPAPQYTFISGTTIDPLAKSLKVIDAALAEAPLEQGGLRWRFVHNIWLGGITLWQRGLLAMTIGKQYDTIIYHGAMYYLSTWVSACIARLQGKRVLMWTHGFYGTETGLKSLVRATFYKLAHGMLLYGHHARGIMIEKGFEPDALYVIYNSLDYVAQKRVRKTITPAHIQARRERLFRHPERAVAVFSGRLVAAKRLSMIFEAAALLAQRDVRINLLIIGDGPDQATLQHCAAALGLADSTCFYGACYDEDELALLLSASNVCISPEGVGLTAIHALAYGVPVITHDDIQAQKPEFEAIVPGVSGDFFRRGDIEDLAAVTQRLLERNSGTNADANAEKCIDIVERLYNPGTQLVVLDAAIRGVPAGELLRSLGDRGHNPACVVRS